MSIIFVDQEFFLIIHNFNIYDKNDIKAHRVILCKISPYSMTKILVKYFQN